MAKFTDYTQKTKPADADLLLIHDNAGAANKKTPFSGVWSWILDKLASAVISQLETTNKSIIPAINELNSKIVDPITRTYTYPNFSASNGQKVTIQIEMEKASNYYPICAYDTQFGESFLITNSWSSSNSISMQILNNSGKDVSGNISIILIKKNLN